MNLNLLGGLTFLLVFGGSILIHEIGHFIAARSVGIEVEEFGIGFPPKMFTFFTWKGTKFTMNWIPFGGFNRMKGEDDPDASGGFMTAKPWARIVTLLAGSAMNILVAIVAFSILYTQVGVPKFDIVQILDVSQDSPAYKAGIQVEDVIYAANGEEITSTDQFRNIILSSLDESIELTVLRGESSVDLVVVPDSTRSEQEGATGILMGAKLEPVNSWFETIPISLRATYETSRELLSLPGRIIAGVIQPSEAGLLGPRSIWNLFQQSVERDVESRQQESGSEAQVPTNYTLSGIISLTLSLGIINLLPIPALDGGRIIFVLLEVIFRRKIPARFESMVHGITFLILISLLGYFYILDFINPVSITLP